MKILAFAASHSPDSVNQALLGAALDLISTHEEVSIHRIPYAALDVPLLNSAELAAQGAPARVDEVKAQFDAADALLIASPEYNWSYPGSLKNLIDWLSTYRPNPLNGKPVFLMCATPSATAGVMCMTQLKSLLGGWIGMHVYPRTYGFGQASQHLQGERITDAAKEALLATELAGFIEYAKKLA